MSDWERFDSFLDEQDKAESDAAEQLAARSDEDAQRGDVRDAQAREWMDRTVRPALQELEQRFRDRGQGWVAQLTPETLAAEAPDPDATKPENSMAVALEKQWAELTVTKGPETKFTYRLELRDDRGTTTLSKSITVFHPKTGAVQEDLGWGKFRSDNARIAPTEISREEIMADFREDFEFRMRKARH